jgi:hypothetical protein
MITVEEKKICEICGVRNAVIFCDGCEKALCEQCRHFDLWSYGCGNINPKAFCRTCMDDIQLNPWGGERPD